MIDKLQDILDLLRTGLPPAVYTMEQWNEHKVNKAAAMLQQVMNEMPKYDVQAHQLAQLFLVSPETGNRCEFCSPLRDNERGTYSFDVKDVVTGEVWAHSIVTCEKDVADGITMRLKKQDDGTLG